MTTERNRWSAKALTALAIGLCFSAWPAVGSTQSIPLRSVRDLTMVCMGCHNPEPGALDLKEAQRIPRLGAQQRDYLANALNAYRTRQREHFYMRGMALGLKGDELERVLDHLSAPVQAAGHKATNPSRTAMPPEAATCIACHGDHIRPPINADTPRLAGQHAPYLEAAFMAYAEGRRMHSVMGPQASKPNQSPAISAEVLTSVAQWFSGIPGLEAR